MTSPATFPRRLTIEEFFAAYSGRDEKYVLVDGVPRMMAHAKRRHGQIMGILLWRLNWAVIKVLSRSGNVWDSARWRAASAR